MKLSLIVAMSLNRCIGANGKIPWNLPIDLANFEKVTKHHTVIMGRKTWESLPNGPLKRRINIVITKERDEDFVDKYEGCTCVKDLKSAVAYASAYGNNIFFIGGTGIYEEAVKNQVIDSMYITLVNTVVEGDAFFPDINTDNYKLIEASHHEQNGLSFVISRYDLDTEV